MPNCTHSHRATPKDLQLNDKNLIFLESKELLRNIKQVTILYERNLKVIKGVNDGTYHMLDSLLIRLTAGDPSFKNPRVSGASHRIGTGSPFQSK